MSDIIELDDYRPHITIMTLDKNVHVIPVSVIEKIIKGEMPIEQLEDWQMIIRSIVDIWLNIVLDNGSAGAEID